MLGNLLLPRAVKKHQGVVLPSVPPKRVVKSDLSGTTKERKQFWEEVGVLNDRNHNVNMFRYYATRLGNFVYIHYRVTTFRADK